MTFTAKPYTLPELAGLYQVSPKIMRRWLQSMQPQLGIRRGCFYTLPQVLFIITKLGVPGLYQAQSLERK